MSWLETVRSIVQRWEIDNTDHFTVAYYFMRLGDAAFAMLDTLGLAPDALRASCRVAAPTWWSRATGSRARSG